VDAASHSTALVDNVCRRLERLDQAAIAVESSSAPRDRWGCRGK
jgi:hypothetical protein